MPLLFGEAFLFRGDMKILKFLAIFFLGLGIGSYLGFYPERIYPTALAVLFFKIPVALGFILALILWSIYSNYVAIKKTFEPKKQKETNTIKKYMEVRETLKTGDVVAFGGTNIGAFIIRFFTWSRYSHVGLIVRVPMPNNDSRIFFIEADDKKGVVLVRLSSKMVHYKGDATLFKLKRLLPTAQNDEQSIYKYSLGQLGKDYDMPAIKGISEKILGVLNKVNPQDDGSFICSELVARALQNGNYISADQNASYMSPKNITELKCFEIPMRLTEEIKD
jgi:hypothetical protein